MSHLSGGPAPDKDENRLKLLIPKVDALSIKICLHYRIWKGIFANVRKLRMNDPGRFYHSFGAYWHPPKRHWLMLWIHRKKNHCGSFKWERGLSSLYDLPMLVRHKVPKSQYIDTQPGILAALVTSPGCPTDFIILNVKRLYLQRNGMF